VRRAAACGTRSISVRPAAPPAVLHLTWLRLIVPACFPPRQRPSRLSVCCIRQRCRRRRCCRSAEWRG